MMRRRERWRVAALTDNWGGRMRQRKEEGPVGLSRDYKERAGTQEWRREKQGTALHKRKKRPERAYL